jgi:hypothetical protein
MKSAAGERGKWFLDRRGGGGKSLEKQKKDTKIEGTNLRIC